jgi:hypothetical protein
VAAWARCPVAVHAEQEELWQETKKGQGREETVLVPARSQKSSTPSPFSTCASPSLIHAKRMTDFLFQQSAKADFAPYV